jgi:hypothetical protein
MNFLFFMRKIFTNFLIFAASLAAQSQTVTFEDLPLMPPQNWWNGVGGMVSKDSFFTSGGCTFPNSYSWDSAGSYSYWSGWAYSNKQDSTSTSYAANEIASAAAGGYNSSQYAVAYQSFSPQFNHIKIPNNRKLVSMYVTNTTIAYRSMQNGDGFAKKFGGTTGNDPDYFRLKMIGWLNGIPKQDTAMFYLADYRDNNNANDYIVTAWRKFDLSILGQCDSLTYTLESTDTNSSGMLTPAYFCIDQIQFEPLNSSDLLQEIAFSVTPNPFSDILLVKNTRFQHGTFHLYSLNGKKVLSGEVDKQSSKTILTDFLPKGNYMMQVLMDHHTLNFKLVK